jgi:hypothetical protein
MTVISLVVTTWHVNGVVMDLTLKSRSDKDSATVEVPDGRSVQEVVPDDEIPIKPPHPLAYSDCLTPH